VTTREGSSSTGSVTPTVSRVDETRDLKKASNAEFGNGRLMTSRPLCPAGQAEVGDVSAGMSYPLATGSPTAT
jgi:hypothetical protein